MIDTLILLLALSPLIVAISWYIIEMHEINLHKQEMEQLWDLYAEESTLPGTGEPIYMDPVGHTPYSEDTVNSILEKKPKHYMNRDPSIPYRDRNNF